MTAAVVALAIAVILLLILLLWTLQVKEVTVRRLSAEAAKERLAYLEQLEVQQQRAGEERRALADRIQHPERIQVQPGENPDPYIPRDAAEMAYIGQLVPEFVHVGSPNADSPQED